jgi:hypothetical protein
MWSATRRARGYLTAKYIDCVWAGSCIVPCALTRRGELQTLYASTLLPALTHAFRAQCVFMVR